MADWYYEYEDEERGPVSRAELIHFIRTDALRADSLVWRKDMPKWQTIENTKVLREFLKNQSSRSTRDSLKRRLTQWWHRRRKK